MGRWNGIFNASKMLNGFHTSVASVSDFFDNFKKRIFKQIVQIVKYF
ncbi:Uncharacterized protein dnm_037510 [Desulfonema magnum]|uniref:Uncharacterized protein n=1 Tax=Desulfonema magnum TaxID=45655 RepID=A0A975GN89_9BACT|nr:Uncharacterized protein dnm_037510 [Desulfonema magnum]